MYKSTFIVIARLISAAFFVFIGARLVLFKSAEYAAPYNYLILILGVLCILLFGASFSIMLKKIISKNKK